MATSTSGASPGVWMSQSEMWTWNARHTGAGADWRADLGWEVGKRGEVVAEQGAR